jgi:hypothetical protein
MLADPHLGEPGVGPGELVGLVRVEGGAQVAPDAGGEPAREPPGIEAPQRAPRLQRARTPTEIACQRPERKRQASIEAFTT